MVKSILTENSSSWGLWKQKTNSSTRLSLWVSKRKIWWIFTEGIRHFSPPDVAFLTYMNEWMKSRGWEDNRRALLQYIFNMWTVSSEVSIQSRHWQPLSVHLWAYCTQPAHDVNDVICEGWPQHHGSASPTLFEQWCGFFYVPHEPEV